MIWTARLLSSRWALRSLVFSRHLNPIFLRKMVLILEDTSFYLFFAKGGCRGDREHLVWCNSPESDLGASEGCRQWIKSPVGILSPCQNQTSACMCRLVFAGFLTTGGFRFSESEASPIFLPQRQLRHGHQTSKELCHTGARNPTFFSALSLLDHYHDKGGLLTFIAMMPLIWGLLWFGALGFIGPEKQWSPPGEEQG